jgi:hypothetical protein
VSNFNSIFFFSLWIYKFSTLVDCTYSCIFLSIHPFIQGGLLRTWPIFQFLNPYTIGRTPWKRDQLVARPLPTTNSFIKVSRDRAVGTATGYWSDSRKVGVQLSVESRIFTSPRRPGLLSNGYRVLFPLGLGGRAVKLTTHLQLVLRTRKCGFIHPLPRTPSWCNAWLVKNRENFNVTAS